MSPASVLTAFLLLATLPGCDDSSGSGGPPDASGYVDSCLATCQDQLTVHLAGLVPDQIYQVEASAGQESQSCTFDTHDGLEWDCGGAIGYGARLDEATLFFLGTPPSVTVSVSRDGSVVASETLDATYTTRQKCATTCQIAAVTLQIR